MPYAIRYDPKLDCVFVRMEGEIDLALAKQFAKELGEQVSRHNCKRVLNDMRQATLTLSLTELFKVPDEIGETWLRTVKRALVVAQDFMQYDLFASASFNRGQLLEVFIDPEQAMRWLLG